MSRVIVMKMGQFGELWKIFDRVTTNTLAVENSDRNHSSRSLSLDATNFSLRKSKEREELEEEEKEKEEEEKEEGQSSKGGGLLQQLLDDDSGGTLKVYKGTKIGSALKNKILSSSLGEDVLTMSEPTTKEEEVCSPSTSVPNILGGDSAVPTSTGEDPVYFLNIIKDETPAPPYDDNDIFYSLSNSSTMTLLQNNEMEIGDNYEGNGSSPSMREASTTSQKVVTTTSAVSSTVSPESPDRHHCSSTSEPNLFSGDSIKEEGPRRMCLVCGDVASGFHYGVSSCEACKAFFKRTIQGNIEYTCPASNECEINKRRRKACQACRFQKCLKMGMLKEGVRLDRVRGGRQKYRRMIDSNPYIGPPPKRLSLEDNKLLQALRRCEPEEILANPDPNLPDNELKTITILSDFYDRELIGTIEWAKQIPGFSDLTINDQMRLLQSSWSEILTLTLIYRSLPRNGKLYLAADFSLNESQAQLCGLSDFFFHCMRILERVERAGLRKEEYILLKSIIIANCDVSLEEYTSLCKLRENLLLSLHDTVAVLRTGNSNINVQCILLLLPSIRQADSLIHQFWDKVRHDGKISLNKLLVEMLDAQRKHR